MQKNVYFINECIAKPKEAVYSNSFVVTNLMNSYDPYLLIPVYIVNKLFLFVKLSVKILFYSHIVEVHFAVPQQYIEPAIYVDSFTESGHIVYNYEVR